MTYPCCSHYYLRQGGNVFGWVCLSAGKTTMHRPDFRESQWTCSSANVFKHSKDTNGKEEFTECENI